MGSMGGEEVVTGCEERILVSVRIRPLNDYERARNDASDWECINDTTIIYRNKLSASDRSLYPTAYTFDRVFRTDCSTRQVYEEAAKEVALSVVSGINSSIFAYGQTSSGKTYTMSGITEYTVADIFDYIEKHKEREFVLKFSAIEIYNESVRDLLSLDSTPLRLLDDPERGTVVEKLTEETLRDWNHFSELISFCETQRQIGETSLNQASSRSHQILRLTIESSAREFLGNDKSSSLAACVNFIDLAGSERASQTLSAGTRLKEGCHINRSLLTLGTVIRKLSKGRNGHIPFRDSKLTRILQSSLGGNARTAVICTMSPARSHVEQTRNTLLFASCAKEVSTNAQVNVVVSDKALVKQLQRELARLESELRNSGSAGHTSDSAAMREKDLLIETLKKEVAELTIQRDLAQSQIRDMLNVSGDNSSTELESSDPQYPKLRVRRSWDFDRQIGEPNLSSLNCMESVRSFDASQYSDGHSISSDENLFQLPDFEKNFPRRNLPPRPPVTELDAVESDLSQNHIEEEDDENLEDHWKEISCIESEDLTTNKVTNSTLTQLTPNPYTNSNASSPGRNIDTSGLTIVNKRENFDMGSCGLKGDKELKNFYQDFVVSSLGKISPWLSENSASSSRCLKLSKSRSCKASLMMNSSSYWFDRDETLENTPPIGIVRELTGRPVSFQGKVCTLNYDVDSEKQSRNEFGNSEDAASIDEVRNVETSIDKETDANGTSSPGRKSKEDLGSVKQLADHKVPEEVLETPACAKSFKDVGLDPLQCNEESPSKWPSEFKRLQREIIELWDACNVSLVHRTYFFLLFKGDSSDSIYMEVELRRLSYLKQTFSQGNQTVEDGRLLTPTTSLRYLRRERQMLSRQIQRRLTKSGRENLYLKWGIPLNSKNRALQLAHQLWTDTQDMNHITESAVVVAKLLGSVEPEQAFKEMFGLNFAPRRPSRRSFSLSYSFKHIL